MTKSILKITALMVVLLTAFPLASDAASPRVIYLKNQLTNLGFSSSQVNALFTDSRLRLLPVVTVVYKAPNWNLVRQKLYSPTFVAAGKNYIQSNQAVFDKTEQDFGVPKEALASLIAIETEFGKSAGTYRTFNALYSRMIHWPATTWKGPAAQLIAFSKYCLQSQIDCFNIRGSYAGAFGLVQFMPAALTAYGVDGDGNGVIDLSSPADAIPSAANFLKAHGWATNPLGALTAYYGSSVGYPNIVLTYASLLAK